MPRLPLLVALLLPALAVAAEGVPPLVDGAWVKTNSCADGVTVLDVRNRLGGASKTNYLEAHIPCAIHSDYMKDGWRSKVDGVVGQLPPTESLEKLIGGLGIDNNTHVVVVSSGASALAMGSATRVYWTFKVLGHDKVSLLDGGMGAYAADKNNPLEKGEIKPQAARFTASLRQDMLVSKDDVARAVEQQSAALIDHRPADMYLGVNRHGKAKRNGTLPGALNVPERWLTQNGGGTFRDKGALASLFDQASVPDGEAQINFCNTGHWASLGWFTSHELLGNKNAKLYDGSMVEWTADESLPVEVKVPVQ